MVLFCRQLSTLYEAGVPLMRSLDTLKRQSSDKRLRRVVAEINRSLSAGDTFGQAVERQSKYFPQFFIELIKAGEKGGKLDEILRSLAFYYERRLSIFRQFVSRLIFPVLELVIGLSIALFAFALISNLDVERGGDWTKVAETYTLYLGIAASVAAALIVAVFLLRHFPATSTLLSHLALGVPVVRGMIIKLAIARFTRALALLLESGLPAPAAWERSAATAQNRAIRRSLQRSVAMLEHGSSFYEAASRCRYLNPMVEQMILTGEESGRLDQMMHKVATTCEEELEVALGVLARVVGVVIHLIILAILGGCVIALYASYYSRILGIVGM